MFITRVALESGKGRVRDASVCIFKSIEAMSRLCRVLRERGYGKESSAYEVAPSAYALILPEFDRDAPLPLGAAVISEFGYRRDCENIEGYIKERARVIVEGNAVARLAEFC